MKKILLWTAGIAVFIAALAAGWIAIILSDLPDVAVLKHYRPAAAAEVLDRDGIVLAHYYDRKFRIWVPIASVPEIVVRAVVIAEDDTFFEHKGINYQATKEALLHDVQKRRFARGGSTITQQMIKNVLLSKEKTITRKVREYVLARQAEELLTKHRILEIYLNEVEWGDNIYGIEAASRYYLDKHVAELSIDEAAMLAGMLPNPRYYNPFKRMDKVGNRRDQVLFNMQQAKVITKDEYTAALQAQPQLRQEGSGRFDLSILTGKNGKPCAHYALEQILISLFGEQAVYRGGRTYRTTLDRKLQNEVRAWESVQPDRPEKPIKDIRVITNGGQVRAIACIQGKEAELQSLLDSLGLTAEEFKTESASTESIARDQIVIDPETGMK